MGAVSLLFVAIPALILLHLYAAPYTKVEESFHVQAIHDILSYGIPSSNYSLHLQENYDHFSFPGAVPRTFVGAVVLSGLSRPFIWLNESIDRQFLARAILGLLNASALLSYTSGIQRAFGRTTAVWYLLFQASQFHVLYYASRMLSNMFAFGLTMLAMRFLLPEQVASDAYRKRCRLALYLLTIAGIVFRSEIALFLATHTIFLLLAGRVTILQDIIPAGILGLLIGLAFTVGVDSFFWQQFPLWPEFTAFKFNVISGNASAWGTHPWYFYFSNAIPRLLLNPLTYLIGAPMALVQPATRRSAAYILIPSLAFVTFFSIQPHKEWRFIVYTVPPLTAVSALGASYIWTHRAKSFIYRILSLLMIGSTFGSFVLSTFVLLPSSSANYPGAHALHALHRHAHDSKPEISVYLNNLACQTGVTRFLQLPPSESPLVHLPGSPDGSIPALQSGHSIWKYDKTEDEATKSTASFWEQFDYVLVEPGDEEKKVLAASGHPDQWEVVDAVDGFAGLRFLRPGVDATGQVEKKVLHSIFGQEGVRLWESGREFVRRSVTRGWWAEIRMEPKIKILRHVQ
ncbi:hypothetical protein ASPWEDRAFT_166512 [Aspergillus wentii DTO 134E9]|uniref:Mannosyltransferase n=1 Tax=Aspergillus wentii DTO 134E9 TaxID=1073089 RepID=A0A1L9RZV1_ASPWE|nr:uncharacterized protein ASPWEDRAFT_166512 [Aspergillus wentii DTO 134E9]KAI9932860.1 dolichyl-P-Man:Man(7)GlcNAc(2)-PP-dolichol alpha-1,6-mannosyltransferase [Aspergillus wentii]OJJ40445.1 hypothetical protein ASPWEDRAFT_166512 [Aspergillus wentii DTO 134E9]